MHAKGCPFAVFVYEANSLYTHKSAKYQPFAYIEFLVFGLFGNHLTQFKISLFEFLTFGKMGTPKSTLYF